MTALTAPERLPSSVRSTSGGLSAWKRCGVICSTIRSTGATHVGARSDSTVGLLEPLGLGSVTLDSEKQLAAEAASRLIEDSMVVGLGTGSTVGYLLSTLAARGLDLRCVATSPATEQAARELGMKVDSFRGTDALVRLDIAIDGADQVAPSGWLVKGGGAAHTREKVVAAAADRFVVIVSSDKFVEKLSPPVPLELLEYGLGATLRRLGDVRLRDVARSPDGGVIADYFGDFDDPEELAARLSATVGVVEHGLFPAAMVSDIVIGRGEQVEIRSLR